MLIKKINPLNTKNFTESTVKEFTDLEHKLMQEVRSYSQVNGVETVRVINKNGRNVKNKAIEKPLFTTPLSANGMILGHDFGLIGQIIKGGFEHCQGTFIHSHTADVPLSSQDLRPLVAQAYRKIIAITPNGSISSIERPKGHLNFLKIRKMFKERKKFSEIQTQKAKELGLLSINSATLMPEWNFNASTERVKEYSDFSIKLLQNFANKFGFRFFNNFN